MGVRPAVKGNRARGVLQARQQPRGYVNVFGPSHDPQKAATARVVVDHDGSVAFKDPSVANALQAQARSAGVMAPSTAYSSGVTLVDGKPVKYWSRAEPLTREEELRELAERIQKLTGRRVRFGTWERLFEYNPLDACSEVPLVVID